jgi:3-oxoacyl-[acyl-carrier-protein] synthase-3
MGTALPENCVPNDALAAKFNLDTSDAWIRPRTGIAQRYLADETEHASTLGTAAARAAMADAGVLAEDIDLLIVATMSPDYPFPAVACQMQHALGLGNIGAFDVHAACSGFVYALEVGTRMVQSGAYTNVLVVGAEKMSSIVDWEDRATCVLFGDAAGAAVLKPATAPGQGVLACDLGSNGANPEWLCTPAGGSNMPITEGVLAEKNQYLKMQGREIFKVAVRCMAGSIQRVLDQAGVGIEDVQCLVPHQANTRIIEALAKHLNFPKERCYLNIHNYGNTSAASIPLALAEARTKGAFKPGDLVLLTAFGGGLTWASTLIKW